QHGGLGLAICQKLMQLLQSDISVQSELGQGTTFQFWLSAG
ncbi:MAG: signal transduction histidine kinase, partial [Alteromonadaceae bacterium]